jgi:hypothetical protein
MIKNLLLKKWITEYEDKYRISEILIKDLQKENENYQKTNIAFGDEIKKLNSNIEAKDDDLKKLELLLNTQNDSITQYQDKISDLENKIDEVRLAACEYKNYLKLLDGTKSKTLHRLLQNTFSSLNSGKINLTVRDFYQFWTDIFEDKNVIYFRCTTRLDPENWNTFDMKLYQNRQIANVNKFNCQNAQENDENCSLLKKVLKEMKITNITIENFFERIFIIDEKLRQDSDYCKKLSKLISDQIHGNIYCKIICIKHNERPTVYRPQDFGVLVFKNGDVFSMYLDIDKKGRSEGGQVILDKNESKKFLEYYNKINEESTEILKNDPIEIEGAIKELNIIDISKIYGNRCFNCLSLAENKVKSGEWNNDISPLKTWYQIVHDENKIIPQILKKTSPKNILEIGLWTR